MRRIDALHLDYPFAGSRMLRDLLRGEGVVIGREMVRTMMRRMCIEALHRRPNTSKPCPGHKIYPYLLRGLTVERPNQVWCMEITYIPMAPAVLDLGWRGWGVVGWRRWSWSRRYGPCGNGRAKAMAPRSSCQEANTT
jgi:putative transposase